LAIGTVKFFQDRLGWGFIQTPEGAEYFVHYRDLIGDGHRTLVTGDRVQFEIEEGPKGAKAIHVIRLQD